MFAHPGHLKLSTGSHTTSLVTPVLSAIPDGHTAILEVKVTMARRASDVKSALTMAVYCVTSGERHENLWIKDTQYSESPSAAQELTNHGEWKEYTFTISGVSNTDRLNIRPAENGYTNGKAVHYINDVTVTVKALAPVAE